MSMSHIPLRYAHNEGHTDVCFSCDGEKYITCGSDGDMRIWSQDVYQDPVHSCVGEWALALRQTGTKLYVATGSNDIQIITFPEGDRHGVLDRYVAPINNIALSKDGNLIALAAEEMEVKVIKIEGENKDVTVLSEMSGPCLSVALCPNSQLVAASSGDGKLRIWNIEEKSLLKEINCFPKVNSFANAKLLCRIDFEPNKGRNLAYPNKNVIIVLEITSWEEIAQLSCESVTESYSIVQYSPCGKYLAATSAIGDFVIWEVASQSVHNSTKHPNGTAVCAFMWNPTGLDQIVYTDVEGQLGVISECIKENHSTNTESVSNDNEVDFGDLKFDDDDDEDNENAVSIEKLKKQYANDVEDEIELAMSRPSTPRPKTPELPLQDTFMASSTPEHLNPRYLCWNGVGIIRSYGNLNIEDDEREKSIEVDFHDSTFHNSMMMQNYQNYSMGSLSITTLVVANSSQINVIPLASRTTEWTLNMDEGEEIALVTSSEHLVCVGLTNYLVKVCSSYGTQRAVFSVSGPLVCMAAFKTMVLVAYHSGGIRKGDQCISFKLVKIEGTSLEGKELGATLGPQCTLRWLGFSDCGTPCVMDSSGLFYMYPLNSNLWIPFFNTFKHMKALADTFFVTSVSESNQTLVGIKCKGTIYPPVIPRPTMCEMPIEPAFAEMSTDKSQLESKLFTWSSLQVENTDKLFKETALKTFALACKTNLEQRALEVMEILANSQVLTLGIKYATKLDKRRLADKLIDLASKLSDENEENIFMSNETTDGTVTKPVVRRLTLGSKTTPKNKAQPKEVITPSSEPNPEPVTPISNDSVNITINTQESLFPEERKNPFLKSLKKTKPTVNNPLSLTDKSAGVNFELDSKQNKVEQVLEKRKQPDSETDKQKSKQRKLDRFMFTKRP